MAGPSSLTKTAQNPVGGQRSSEKITRHNLTNDEAEMLCWPVANIKEISLSVVSPLARLLRHPWNQWPAGPTCFETVNKSAARRAQAAIPRDDAACRNRALGDPTSCNRSRGLSKIFCPDSKPQQSLTQLTFCRGSEFARCI